MRWVLVDLAPKILPELGEDLASYAHVRLLERGVEIALHTRLESYLDGVVALSDGRSFPADTLVWTAGVRPSPLARASGLPVDDAGRILTDTYLRVRDVEDAWAAGDAAAVPDPASGGISPPTAQYGMRQGRALARNLTAAVHGGTLEPFEHRNIGAVCSLGRYKGVAVIWSVKIKGFPAWFAHRSYHLYAMPTLTRKVKIAADWTVALLFPRDLAQLGSLERPREPFERAAKD
jgi:NADH dehydrogenase